MYMLNTNIASQIIRGDRPNIIRRLTEVPIHKICVSAITKAEQLYGVAKRGNLAGLAMRVNGFLVRVAVLGWSADVASSYGVLRADCESRGITLAPIDMMIAAHAVAIGAVLAMRDQVFSCGVHDLRVEEWDTAL